MFLKFLLYYALIPQHKANYAHCFIPIMLSSYNIYITNLFSLLVMITLATHFCAQDRQATTTLDLIAH